jgi:pyridinium-3,5-biscarboxylic acid mononucleotide sulfurtransferase
MLPLQKIIYELNRINKMEEKIDILISRLKQFRNAIVAFSGGVDSTLLARVAKDVYGDNLLLVTATSSTNPFYELDEAKSLALMMKIRHLIIVTEEIDNPGYAANPPDRCYFCKSELFTKIQFIAARDGYEAVLDGSNAEDMKDFRPGMKAKKEKSVISPLAEAGFTKDDIRQLSRKYNLPTASKQSYACLASRIPYGETITKLKLDRLATSEYAVRKLGFTQFRIRSHENLARFEFIPDEMNKAWELKDRLTEICLNAGFSYVTIDLKGYRSGSMNEVLPEALKLSILNSAKNTAGH